METDSIDCPKKWIAAWNDLAEFEIIPVIRFAEARKRIVE
jgi:hypothetical protein